MKSYTRILDFYLEIFRYGKGVYKSKGDLRVYFEVSKFKTIESMNKSLDIYKNRKNSEEIIDDASNFKWDDSSSLRFMYCKNLHCVQTSQLKSYSSEGEIKTSDGKEFLPYIALAYEFNQLMEKEEK